MQQNMLFLPTVAAHGCCSPVGRAGQDHGCCPAGPDHAVLAHGRVAAAPSRPTEPPPGFMWADMAGGGCAKAPGKTYEDGSVMSDPYLPGPERVSPVERGQASFRVNHQRCQRIGCPDQHVCEERTYRSYGEWWQAHQHPPPVELQCAQHKSVAGTYWPYGVGVTKLSGTIDPVHHTGHEYLLDKRALALAVPHRPRDLSSSAMAPGHAKICSPVSSRSSPPMSSSRSAPGLQLAGSAVARTFQQPLLGSHAEATRAKMQV